MTMLRQNLNPHYYYCCCCWNKIGKKAAMRPEIANIKLGIINLLNYHYIILERKILI